MRSIMPVKTAKTGCILSSAALCILGIFLIINPELSVSFIGIATGILIILFGCFKIIGYFSKDLFRLAFEYDLAFGILMLVIGTVILIRPEGVMSLLCILIGMADLADGLFKIQIAMEAKPFGIKYWWVIMVMALLSIGISMVLLFRPEGSAKLLVILFGASLLAEGLLNLITMLTTVKIVRHQRPDTAETKNNCSGF